MGDVVYTSKVHIERIKGPLRVARLSTWWGPLDYELRRTASGLHVRIGGLRSPPPGGVVLAPPDVDRVTVRELPADFEVQANE